MRLCFSASGHLGPVEGRAGAGPEKMEGIMRREEAGSLILPWQLPNLRPHYY